MITKRAVLLFLLVPLSNSSTWIVSLPARVPKPGEVAKMARYIMSNSDWVAIATVSTQENIQGYPFVSLESVSDGPRTNSTGVPYLYLSDLEFSGKDLETDSRCTIMASLAQSDYCKRQKFDPQDPRCAKLMITGRVVKLDESSSEYKFGQEALFSRHPAMKSWPKDHAFYVLKIDIEQVAVFDSFGGPNYVSVEDYFNAHNEILSNDVPFNNVEYVEVFVRN